MKIKYKWQGQVKDGEVTSQGVTGGRKYYAIGSLIIYDDQVMREEVIRVKEEIVKTELNVDEIVKKIYDEVMKKLEEDKPCKLSRKEILKNFVRNTVKKSLGLIKKLKQIKLKKKASKTE